MAEKSTVQLIEIFLNLTEIKETNKNGERLLRLPFEQVTEENRREEYKLPIDKYDWLSFERIFQETYQYPESERERMCEHLLIYTKKVIKSK